LFKDLSEARGHKNKNKNKFKGNNRQEEQWDKFKNFNQRHVVGTVISPGMKMEFSARFAYLLTKMTETGNKIAKELLALKTNTDKKFEMSYLDLTNKEDTISYLPTGGRDLPDAEKYKSNKRQHVKIYKTIKTIFGAKYTKTDVQKFVSIFKSIYNKGPEKRDLPTPTEEQIVKNLIKDTESDKLKWVNVAKGKDFIRCVTDKQIDEKNKKVLRFTYYVFNDLKEQDCGFLTAHLIRDPELTPITNVNTSEKDSYIKTIMFKSQIENMKKLKTLLVTKCNIVFNED
jgi:hypothetical protein